MEKNRNPKSAFYVAECTEFHILGEYHEDLSLEEAAELYQTIPADRMNGIKGIGFRLEDGSIYDGTYELMTAGKKCRRNLLMKSRITGTVRWWYSRLSGYGENFR